MCSAENDALMKTVCECGRRSVGHASMNVGRSRYHHSLSPTATPEPSMHYHCHTYTISHSRVEIDFICIGRTRIRAFLHEITIMTFEARCLVYSILKPTSKSNNSKRSKYMHMYSTREQGSKAWLWPSLEALGVSRRH